MCCHIARAHLSGRMLRVNAFQALAGDNLHHLWTALSAHKRSCIIAVQVREALHRAGHALRHVVQLASMRALAFGLLLQHPEALCTWQQSMASIQVLQGAVLMRCELRVKSGQVTHLIATELSGPPAQWKA